MSLRTRLVVVLAGLFLLPLVVGGLILAVVLPDARSDRVVGAAQVGASAVAHELTETCAALGVTARNAALEASAGDDPAGAVRLVVESGYADYAALLDSTGAAVAEAGELPAGVGEAGRLPQCSDVAAGSGVLAQRVAVSGVSDVAQSVTAVDLTAAATASLSRLVPDGHVVLLSGGEVVATTAGTAMAAELARAATTGVADDGLVDGWAVRSERAGQLPYVAVVALPEADEGLRTVPLALVVVAAALAAGLLVTAVARDLSRPYAELTRVAERAAGGDLDIEVETDEEGEAGRLGSAISTVVDELRRRNADLQRSRDELHESLERIGDTLTATHDLDGMLNVVLETARAMSGALAGVVLYRKGVDLELVAEEGLHEAGLTAPVIARPGEGVLGRVASEGRAVRGRIGSGPPSLEPCGDEPSGVDVLAVPLRSSGRIMGVLALYGRTASGTFEPPDEDALSTLANQAGIAIDNINLHQEAQRLSTTDPLTGVWNFRYLSMSLAREIERSSRFDRPLAVLMLDLDHFKNVNDTYGHACGDSVLREVTERVMEHIREVDILARYGGEEFVVVLPETAVEGAAQLADRICTAVRRQPFVNDVGEPIAVTVSVGGAAFPDQGSTPATLMRSADQALYVAKARGRDQWHVPGISPD